VHEDISDNLAGRVTLSRGHVEAALGTAPRRASVTLRIGRAGGQPMETRGLVAEYNAVTELLTVWASSQVPHQIRQFICDLLQLEPHRVRVVAPDVGGGFGAKLIVYPEDVLIPFLALRFGRPVRWLEDRLEHMLTATQERTQVHTVEIGFDDEGRLLALRDRFVHDTGAYTPRGLVVPLLSASMLAGPYRIPNVEVTFDSVYTHRVPVTPYRGAGQPQAVFVIERVMDLIARETGRDRAAVRFANLVQSADMPYDAGLPNYRGSGNVIYDSGDYPAVLRRALEMADYEQLAQECRDARRAGRLVGIGVACYVELTGVGPFEGATIRADAAGRLTVFTGVPSQGQGLETTLAQIAADELGVTPAEVAIVGGDTLGLGQGIGTFASRAAVVGGTAVALAARELRAKAVRLAAQALGLAEDEIQQQGKRFAERGNPERQIELGRVASVAAMATAAHGVAPGLEATHFFQPPDIAYSAGAHVVLVEVDPETLSVRLRGYWVSHDSGRLINPTIVEGQIQGAVALGIGSVLFEEIRYDEAGQPLAASYMDYALPRSDDLPSIEIDHLETPSPLNPLGLKGVGESGTLPVAAVIASAVEDALSDRATRVDRVPLTPRELRRLVWPEAAR
jgi:aerobic carbon-monoxide dehydrogenase large subunit